MHIGNVNEVVTKIREENIAYNEELKKLITAPLYFCLMKGDQS